MLNKGHFIVVEGLEGAGKTTAMNTIKRFLIEHNKEYITTREPGGTRVGETVRQLIKESQEPLDPRAELLLFYAARVQLIENVIRPALNKGCWVLADRFELSTFAYQGGGRGMDEHMIQHLSKFCVREMKPDLIIFLDVDPKQGLKRVFKRGKPDRIEQESLDFFMRVSNNYHQHMATMDNVVIIDANKSLIEVQDNISEALQVHYNTQVQYIV